MTRLLDERACLGPPRSAFRRHARSASSRLRVKSSTLRAVEGPGRRPARRRPESASCCTMRQSMADGLDVVHPVRDRGGCRRRGKTVATTRMSSSAFESSSNPMIGIVLGQLDRNHVVGKDDAGQQLHRRRIRRPKVRGPAAGRHRWSSSHALPARALSERNASGLDRRTFWGPLALFSRSSRIPIHLGFAGKRTDPRESDEQRREGGIALAFGRFGRVSCGVSFRVRPRRRKDRRPRRQVRRSPRRDLRFAYVDVAQSNSATRCATAAARTVRRITSWPRCRRASPSADFNGDGWMDMYCPNGNQIVSLRPEDRSASRCSDPPPRNELYLNRGGKRFEAVGKAAGVDHPAAGPSARSPATSTTTATRSVSSATGAANLLYLNDGKGKFTEVASRGDRHRRQPASLVARRMHGRHRQRRRPRPLRRAVRGHGRHAARPHDHDAPAGRPLHRTQLHLEAAEGLLRPDSDCGRSTTSSSRTCSSRRASWVQRHHEEGRLLVQVRRSDRTTTESPGPFYGVPAGGVGHQPRRLAGHLRRQRHCQETSAGSTRRRHVQERGAASWGWSTISMDRLQPRRLRHGRGNVADLQPRWPASTSPSPKFSHDTVQPADRRAVQAEWAHRIFARWAAKTPACATYTFEASSGWGALFIDPDMDARPGTSVLRLRPRLSRRSRASTSGRTHAGHQSYRAVPTR